MFKTIDTDNSGQITFEKLKVGLEKVGAVLKDSELHWLMQSVSDRWPTTNKNEPPGHGKKHCLYCSEI